MSLQEKATQRKTVSSEEDESPELHKFPVAFQELEKDFRLSLCVCQEGKGGRQWKPLPHRAAGTEQRPLKKHGVASQLFMA